MTVADTPALKQTASSIPSLTDSGAMDLLRVGPMAIEAAVSASHRNVALGATVQLVHQLTGAVAVCYFRRNDEGNLVLGPRVVPNWPGDELENLLPVLHESATIAAEQGAARIKILDTDHHLAVITVPVAIDSTHNEALGAVLLLDAEPIEPFLVILQLVGAMMGLWNIQPPFAPARTKARRADHLTAMLDVLLRDTTLSRGVEALADELKSRLGYQMVALGLCRRRKKTCRLEAVSDLAQFDRRSEVARCMETVFDEAVLSDSIETWFSADGSSNDGSSDNESDSAGTTAQNRLCALTGTKSIVTGPLHDQTGNPLGAWIFLGKGTSRERAESIDSIRAVAPHVGRCLGLLQRAQSGRMASSTRRWAGRSTGLRWLLRILAVATVVGVMMMPMPYKISCECLLQPVTRRYVAAPYEARLEDALVEPGDLVQVGDVLARMNGREIRWQLDEAKAERQQAQKTRTFSLATHDVAAAQIAAFEIEQLDLKIRMLNSRMDHLEIRAPIAGMITSGDLKRTEGAPLERGEVLFEIAPLGAMVVEVAVPADEISRARIGLHVEIRLDAHPKLALSGKLAKIHPRAEQREGENVFIAEVLLDDPDRMLRPGMAGRAKIIGRKHPLAWNLFHKAYDSLVYYFGW